MTSELVLVDVTRADLDEAVEVLSEAFFDYPVMRYVIGEVGEDYERRLRLLVAFFTEARFQRGDRVLAVLMNSEMVGAANVNLPVTRPGVPEEDSLEPLRSRLWSALGGEARTRYESYGEATARFVFPAPRFHLGMIGVQRSATGQGIGRFILDALHRISAEDSDSCGVSLTTETADNVPLYEHFGYRRVGHERVENIETWGFFRPDLVKGDTRRRVP